MEPDLADRRRALGDALASPTLLRSALFAELGGERDPEEEDLTGSFAGTHRLERRLARGGMGDVYLASAPGAAPVAVKVLRRGLASAALVRRCHRERELLAALRHPGIVELRDAGSLADGRPFVVTTFVAGEHLDEYCRSRDLDPLGIARVMLEVCVAVRHAHACGVVHRDLKPTNVLVTAAGVPVVLDFGVAVEPAAGAGGRSTTCGGPPLTPHYASPEVLRGGPASPRGDVYSLGVILRDLLASAPPARPDRAQRDLRLLVQRSTSTEPSDRPADAAALAQELQRILAGRRLRGAGRWRGVLRRHRRLAGLAAGFAMVVAVAGSVASASMARARIAKAEALSVSEFLVRLLDQSGPHAQGQDVSLAQALMLAEADIQTTFRGRPEGEYRVCMAYGRAYAQLGLFRRAAQHLVRAIELIEQDPDAYPESLAWCRRLLERCQHGGRI